MHASTKISTSEKMGNHYGHLKHVDVGNFEETMPSNARVNSASIIIESCIISDLFHDK